MRSAAAVGLLLAGVWLGAAPAAATPGPMRIDYFFEPGCSECERVSREILPVLSQRYEGFYSLHRFDLGIDNPLSFSPEDHQGLERVYLTRLENGHYVLVPDGDSPEGGRPAGGTR